MQGGDEPLGGGEEKGEKGEEGDSNTMQCCRVTSGRLREGIRLSLTSTKRPRASNLEVKHEQTEVKKEREGRSESI